MTQHLRVQVSAGVRRRRHWVVGLAVLAVLTALASGAGWQLWGPDTAAARGAATTGQTTSGPTTAAPGTAEPVTTAPVTAEPGTTAPKPSARLDPELARRFAEAQAAAAADGVELTLTSGSRTAAEQQDLVAKAIARYGSEAKAHAWVLPPETSEHVKGLAIDVGPTAGALWLGTHAREFGLCRTYANEMWHFEKLAKGAEACPDPHPDASWGW